MGFLLGLPANEIVIPLILSIYLQQGGLTETGNLLSLHELLAAQGWTPVTALCTLVFMLFHWPCATTLLTIRKETGSWRWTVLAAVLPAAGQKRQQKAKCQQQRRQTFEQSRSPPL